MTSKAPSTRIRIFLNPQLFLSGFKNFPVHTQRVQIEFVRPHVSDGIRTHSSIEGSSALKCLQSMRRRAGQWREVCNLRPTRAFKLTAILVYCSVRDWTCFLRHRIRKYPDSAVHTLSDSLRIYFFPLWRADLFLSGFAVEIAGYVWTVAVSGKKKLRIRKYPVTTTTTLFIPYLD